MLSWKKIQRTHDGSRAVFYLVVRIQAHVFRSRPLTNSLPVQIVDSRPANGTPYRHHVYLVCYVMNASNRMQRKGVRQLGNMPRMHCTWSNRCHSPRLRSRLAERTNKGVRRLLLCLDRLLFWWFLLFWYIKTKATNKVWTAASTADARRSQRRYRQGHATLRCINSTNGRGYVMFNIQFNAVRTKNGTWAKGIKGRSRVEKRRMRGERKTVTMSIWQSRGYLYSRRGRKVKCLLRGTRERVCG